LHIVQGSALQWDEFQDEHFAQAGLLHLAMPCVIELRNPAESYLLMSGNSEESGRDFLQPQDIAGKHLQAGLAVLSACDFSGSSKTAFDLSTRFPGEFLQAGAGAVIASCGPQATRRLRILNTVLPYTHDHARCCRCPQPSKLLTDSSQQNTQHGLRSSYID
jgi:hypothetical protein